MGSLRFAILKTVDRQGTEQIVLECDQDILKDKIVSGMIFRMKSGKKPLLGYTPEMVAQFFEESFNEVVYEFKRETIRLK